MNCTSLDGRGNVCNRPALARYLTGWRCADHTPAAFAGRPEAAPDPASTLDGLRKAAGADTSKPFTPAGPTLIDQRAVASGKRRSNPTDYKAARQAVDHEESR